MSACRWCGEEDWRLDYRLRGVIDHVCDPQRARDKALEDVVEAVAAALRANGNNDGVAVAVAEIRALKGKP